MSARENILVKLKKADALPMEEPAVFDYYREMGVFWDSEVERLKHWAAAMRAVKTEIYWVTKTSWPQVFRQAAEGKGLKNILLPLATEHGQIARAALVDKRYPGDNRLILPKSPYRRYGLAPRCRLVVS